MKEEKGLSYKKTKYNLGKRRKKPIMFRTSIPVLSTSVLIADTSDYIPKDVERLYQSLRSKSDIRKGFLISIGDCKGDIDKICDEIRSGLKGHFGSVSIKAVTFINMGNLSYDVVSSIIRRMKINYAYDMMLSPQGVKIRTLRSR